MWLLRVSFCPYDACGCVSSVSYTHLDVYKRQFGGIINGFSISLCLLGRATSGGTDFIAVAVSERRNVDAWNYILFGNAVMLVIAGFLFGWDKALYSILFQYASTQVVHLLNPRYKRTTLFIITDKADDIYAEIKDATHHGCLLYTSAAAMSVSRRA